MREGLLFVVVGAGALGVLAMWLFDGPGAALHSFGEALTAIGRVTGLVGTYLVLVQVVLMSRLPWLDRFIGTDRLSAWHRRNGMYAIYLLVAHALFTIWGYGLTDKRSVVGETSTLLRSYPDVLAATVALGLFVLVGVMSARTARRRLKYETWYYVHLYTYLAIALSFAHQLATGDDFVTHPWNRALWIVLYLITGLVLIGYRVVATSRSAVRHDLRVVSVVEEGHSAVSVYMGGRNLADMRARAGQFFRWRFLTRTGWWQSHPFSLSAAPNREYLRITAKTDGDHADTLRHLSIGTRVFAEGPYGNLTTDRRMRHKVLLIAGGIGITPLLALFEEIHAEPGEITLIYRARFERDLVLRSEIEELARRAGAAVYYVLGSRRSNAHALSAKQIAELVPDVAERDVFLCGPPGLMDDAVSALRTLGVRRSHIHHERFEL